MQEQEQRPGESSEEIRHLLRITLRIALGILLLLLLVRTFVAVPYAIPSRSMTPAIEPGDVLLVNKFSYYVRTPVQIPFAGIELPYLEIPGPATLDYGEVVVFSSPEPGRSARGRELVKRVVALPGDAVRLTDSALLVRRRDGSRHRYVGELPTQVAPVFAGATEVIVPYEGYELRLDRPTAQRWGKLLRRNGIEVDYRNNIVFLNGEPSTRYRFTRDYFVAIGDNRTGSRDSRSFGFIPHNSLVGEAVTVMWSRGEEGVRWSRIGKDLAHDE